MNEPQMELVKSEPQAVARFEDPTVGLMAKALELNANPESIASLMAMRRELRAEAAKEAYDRAMAAFQADCPPLVKKKLGAKDIYKYAPIEDIAVHIKPYCLKHGFSYDFDTESDTGSVTAICIVHHSAGHDRRSKIKVRYVRKTDLMSDSQQDAGTFTTAKRQALQNAFGLIIAGEDMDGRQQTSKQEGPSSKSSNDPEKDPLVKTLWGVLAPVRGERANWTIANQWLWREELLDAAAGESMPNNVPTAKLSAVIKSAMARLKGVA